MHPLISIIIPVYNVESYLRECLDSIVMQEYSNYEVIIVDDGSPDNSPSICDKYADAYPQIWVFHKENGGVSSARNVGLENAKGEWIWFVDADDRVKKQSLSVLAESISSYHCDTVFHGLVELYEDGTINEDQHSICINIDKDTFLENNFCFQNGMMLFHADIIKKNNLRFVEGMKMGEDLEFQYRYLMLCNTPIRIEGNYYIYRHREGSAVSNSNTYINNLHNNLSNATHLLQFVKDNNIYSKLWIEKRIQLLLKASVQSALCVKRESRGMLQQKLRTILFDFRKCGFYRIADSTLHLACINLDLYLVGLYLFLKVKRIKL